MAARRSCTHLSWGDAKGKGKQVKSVKATGKLSHKQLIEKRALQGGKFVDKKRQWTRGEIDASRAAKGKEDKQEQAQEVEEEEAATGQDVKEFVLVKSTDLFRERMHERALALQKAAHAEKPGALESGGDLSPEELLKVAECKLQQLDEITALEAIFPEEFLLHSNVDLDQVRSVLETAQDDDYKDTETLRKVASQIPLAFSLELTFEGTHALKGEDRELTAHLLLQVTFTRQYPEHALPLLKIDVATVTHTGAEVPEYKEGDVETLMRFDKVALVDAMLKEAENLQPDPAIYELTTWLSENAFSLVK